MQLINKNDKAIMPHLLLAVICIPAYMHLGEFFKYLIAPYVAYMVWSKRPEFMPALIVHFFMGTIISYLILVVCLALSFANFAHWKKLKIHYLFVLSVLPLPVFVWQTVERMFVEKLGVIDSLTPIGYYLGIFAFFYGILITPKISVHICKVIFGVLFTFFLVQLTGILGSTIRYIFFAIPALIALCFSGRVKNGLKVKKSVWRLGLFSIIIYFIVPGYKTFTMLFSSFLAAFLAYAVLTNKKAISSFLASRKLFITTIGLVVIIAYFSKDYTTSDANFEYTSLSLTNKDELFLKIRAKAFDDRAPIWNAVWLSVTTNKYLLPPKELKQIEFKLNNNKKVEDFRAGAHNILLELLRQYGILVGGLLIFVFITMIVKAGNVLKFKDNPYIVIIASSVISVAAWGGMNGHFVLMPTFSFLIMGLAGICFGVFAKNAYFKVKKND